MLSVFSPDFNLVPRLTSLDGVEIEFDLAKSERPSFDMRGNFSVVTRTSFVRRIGA